MTETQTIKVLELLNAFYAGGKNDPKQQAMAWHLVLQNYNFNDAMAAVLRFAENDKREYATFPAVGRIVAEIRDEAKRKNATIYEIITAVGYGKSYDSLSEGARHLMPESIYEEWLDIDAEEFASKQEMYADVLRARRAQLLEARYEDSHTITTD